MILDPIAVWVLGPAGAGKSVVGASIAAMGFESIDQDKLVEQKMREHGLPLDTRLHDGEQMRLFQQLRGQAADQVWHDVKQKRSTGRALVYEATGNKPVYLEAEVRADRAAGYRVLAIGLLTPLEVCLRRNAQRQRVLPDEVVMSTWNDFRQGLDAGIYARIYGAGCLDLYAQSEFAAQAWLLGKLSQSGSSGIMA